MINEKNTSVGDRIRIARELKGLTQKQLSIMTGTSTAGVCRWESNERELKLSNIVALCEALEVTPNLLIFGQKEPQPSKDDCLKASYEVIGRYEDEIKDLKAKLDTVVETRNNRIDDLDDRLNTISQTVANLMYAVGKISLEKDQEHDFRITCSTETLLCNDCDWKLEEPNGCGNPNACRDFSEFKPK